MNPELAKMTHLTTLKSMLRSIASLTIPKKDSSALSWPECVPNSRLFLGMVFSTLAFTIVMDSVMRQMCARPGSITTAASSAALAGSHASRIRFRDTESQCSLWMVKARLRSSSIVCLASIFTSAQFVLLRPEMRIVLDFASNRIFYVRVLNIILKYINNEFF